MNAKQGVYRNAMDCFFQTVRSEGPRALFKGWLPSYMRLGPQTVLTFIFLEQLKRLYLAVPVVDSHTP